ncbi:DUF4190 domain-containing protein [Streptosporangium sp. NPDC050855]|uniref:DUF4190 domain-containing protein n=1 Tax=Streptosporangium sp. NPDC050855 TaxID=3366194 RepID=UPI0037B7F8E0
MSYGNQSGGYGQPPENGGYGSPDKGSSGYGSTGGYGSPGGYGSAGGYDPAGGYGPGGYGPGGEYGPGGYDPYGNYGGYGPPQQRGNNGMAIAALVMGIVGLFSCGLPSIVGVVLGHISMGQIKRTGEEGRGMAVAGLALSYFGVVCWLGLALLWLVLVGTLGGAALLSGG